MRIQKSKEGSRSPSIFRARLSGLNAKNLGPTLFSWPDDVAPRNGGSTDVPEGTVVGGGRGREFSLIGVGSRV